MQLQIKKSGSESFTRWLTPSLPLTPPHPLLLPEAQNASEAPEAPETGPRLPRLPEVPGRSKGPREAQGARGSKREQGEVRGSKAPESEDPRLPKAPKASWGPRKDPGAQGGSGGKGEWEGARWGREQGEQGSWVWLKTKGCQRLLKAHKASWGPRKVPGAQGS